MNDPANRQFTRRRVARSSGAWAWFLAGEHHGQTSLTVPPDTYNYRFVWSAIWRSSSMRRRWQRPDAGVTLNVTKIRPTHHLMAASGLVPLEPEVSKPAKAASLPLFPRSPAPCGANTARGGGAGKKMGGSFVADRPHSPAARNRWGLGFRPYLSDFRVYLIFTPSYQTTPSPAVLCRLTVTCPSGGDLNRARQAFHPSGARTFASGAPFAS